jgi:hypothetical protein
MIDSLAKNFKMRLKDLRGYAKNIRFFETHTPLNAATLQKNCSLN